MEVRTLLKLFRRLLGKKWVVIRFADALSPECAASFLGKLEALEYDFRQDGYAFELDNLGSENLPTVFKLKAPTPSLLYEACKKIANQLSFQTRKNDHVQKITNGQAIKSIKIERL